MGPNFACGPGGVGAAAVVAALVHVENGGADVLHQFAFHRAAVVVFGAGRDVPKTDIFTPGADAAPAPDSLHAQVGAVAVFVLVTACVNSVEPEGDFRRRTGHADG